MEKKRNKLCFFWFIRYTAIMGPGKMVKGVNVGSSDGDFLIGEASREIMNTLVAMRVIIEDWKPISEEQAKEFQEYQKAADGRARLMG